MPFPSSQHLIRLLILLACSVFLLFLLSLRHDRDQITAASFPATLSSPEASTIAEGPLPKILLVSAFFPFSKSKHTMQEYEQWLSRFLQPITTDVYFYAPPEIEPLVRKCRGDLPITIDTTYASPFDIPPLAGRRQRYEEMHSQDREKFRHSPELYAVWNAKPFFLDDALNRVSHSQKYDYAFWNDAGSFRARHDYTHWPDPARVQHLWQQASLLSHQPPADLLFFPLTGVPHPSMRHWTQDHGPIDNEVSEGSFFGGSPSTVSWWRQTFYNYHDYYLQLGLFVGKDQTLINAIFLLFPSRIFAVWLGDPDAPAHNGLLPLVDQGPLGNCGPEWFYYQFWLASPAERSGMHDIWESNARWSWSWWKKREKCRLTRLSTMTDLLKHRFGPDWEPPIHTITS
ncbi:hypothetical protein MIND_00861800 [Mycena indigotica]|uniref:Uncharacterized protein n=1 Tax=Mycena indigotica TaxID=2126181 RepID=A0A8H6W2D1_9AGAR|nr:uncharacterized protein MIND_00861800 [Mycena indigotica]KAF7299133.1 hypothetical protein MIND_00861800 [Mycena indigotica]